MMNNEELDRKIEFIVNQQARFAIDIDLLRENLSQVSNTVNQLSVNVVQVTEVVTRLARVTHEGFRQVNGKIYALVDAQIRTDAAQKRTEENLQELIRSLTRRSNGNNA
jgi:uncharacterized protein YoxC